MKTFIIHLLTLLTAAATTRAEPSNSSAARVPITFTGDVNHLAFRAVEKRNHALVRGLLRQGMSPNLRSSDGATLLMYAALHGDPENVRLLLHAGANPNATNHHGATALIWGASDLAKVRLLVGSGADVNAKSASGATALTAAAAHTEGTDSVAYLLQAGADISAVIHGEPADRYTNTALDLAAMAGNVATVNVLLEHHAKGDDPAPELSRAFHRALMQDHRDVATYLAEHTGPGGLNPQDLQEGLHAALMHADTELARHLLIRGAQIRTNAPAGREAEDNPVLLAAYSDFDDTEMLSVLIEHGADVNLPGPRGYTALDYVRMRGHHKMERLLLEAGAKSGQPLKQKPIPRNDIRLTPNNRISVISNAVARSVSLLLKSSDVFLQSRESCTSCHNQDLPVLAASIAMSRGIEVASEPLQRIAHRRAMETASRVDRIYDRDKIDEDPLRTLGFRLWGKSAQGLPTNPLTKAQVWYLAGLQLPDGHWQAHLPRPPLEAGAHMPTALIVRALNTYPLEGRESEFANRVGRAAAWLKRTPPKTHTDQTFRLLGLAWSAVDQNDLRDGIDGLIATQKPDGGWSQLPNQGSDAWATGLALLAMQAAGLETSHSVYRRAMEFLLNTQFEDGSWFVRTRSIPFQNHFDSHFPFGYDQWISAAGTAVAAASLALALEPVETHGLELKEFLQTPPSSANPVSVTPAPTSLPAASIEARTVDFENDIRPILENSCVDCHSGAKPKGGFSVATRTSLIEGGESGVKTLAPGRGAESQLIRHVTDQIEDMEMPPMAKRKTYPVLTEKQVRTLITWIDEGVEWPEGAALENR